jgi:hypothetical protein
MFERTRPLGSPELMRVSEFRRYLNDLGSPSIVGSGDGTRASQVGTLSPSLMADLRRSKSPDGHEPLEVMAACIRHGKRVTVHLNCDAFALPLTIFPQEQLVHCPAGMLEFLYTHLSDVSLLLIEPAVLQPPADDEPMPSNAVLHHPLGPVLWQLAMRGLRSSLLSDIAGPAAYRVTPGLDTRRLALSNAEAAAVYRLRRESATARAIAEWPGFDRLRATYLLNALYLQSALIVSRSHPSAIRDSWFSALGPR